jgi:hypothetical protein
MDYEPILEARAEQRFIFVSELGTTLTQSV